MPFSDMPIVECGPIAEFYTDCYGPVDIVGPNFWITLCRVQKELGSCEFVRVPIVRIGHPLGTYRPITTLLEEQRKRVLLSASMPSVN